VQFVGKKGKLSPDDLQRETRRTGNEEKGKSANDRQKFKEGFLAAIDLEGNNGSSRVGK